MRLDEDRQLKIPAHFKKSTLRPDIIKVSESTKRAHPTGANCALGGEIERDAREKVIEVLRDCWSGWKTMSMPVEV